MATAQVAVVKPCGGCESDDALWFCEDCSEYLCERCKNAHQRLAKTKNDTIIPVSKVKEGNKRKIVPVLCEKHKTKICELYCYMCERLICAQCSISSDHESHSFHSVETFIDSKVSELDNIEQNFNDKIVSCNTVLKHEGKEHADYMLLVDQLKEEVKCQTDKIVKEFYKLRDNQLSELSVLQKQEEKRYTTKCEECHSYLNDIQKIIESLQNAKVSGNASIMTRVMKEATQSYQLLDDPSASNLPHPKFDHDETPEAPLFIQLQGCINLPAMDGAKASHTHAAVALPKIDINNVKINLKINLNGNAESIYTMVPTKNNMAWIAKKHDKHLSLIDMKGKVKKKSVEVGGSIIEAVAYDEGFLVTHMESHCVMKLSKDGDSVTTFSDLSPFYPNNLYVTSQQDVLVSLVSSRKLSSSIKSKVVRLDSHGQVMEEMQYRNKKPLFNAANSLARLSTGDVVVLDYVAEDEFRVICIDGRGDPRYIWKGEVGGRKAQHMSLARMTHNDQKVYITDNSNHCLYVLDRHGKAEQLKLETLGITDPWAIFIDNTMRLWLGCTSNIYVLK